MRLCPSSLTTPSGFFPGAHLSYKTLPVDFVPGRSVPEVCASQDKWARTESSLGRRTQYAQHTNFPSHRNGVPHNQLYGASERNPSKGQYSRFLRCLTWVWHYCVQDDAPIPNGFPGYHGFSTMSYPMPPPIKSEPFVKQEPGMDFHQPSNTSSDLPPAPLLWQPEPSHPTNVGPSQTFISSSTSNEDIDDIPIKQLISPHQGERCWEREGKENVTGSLGNCD